MPRGNPIPAKSRRLVEKRDKEQCARCGGAGSEWHHRRKRSVKDEHQHCGCNGVLLCGTCHRWAHANPVQAKSSGFIVTQFAIFPGQWPVKAWHGDVTLGCDGSFTSVGG